ncbi:tryptophan synthase subunit alpha [bacterium]|nr:tryptophan synthase subunit alpha [bacterium]
MNRIDSKFAELNREGRKALITFITAGDPDLDTTFELVLEMERKGADVVELGVPFSDPLADGTTIQRASQRALNNKVRLRDILKLVYKLRKKTEIPIVLMSYLNPIYKYGLEEFATTCRKTGVDGVIIPDLVPEEAEEWLTVARLNKLSTIFLAAPTSPLERIKKIASKSTGFLYYVSLTGVTGARDKLNSNIIEALKAIKRITNKPVACGFGISNPQQARKVSRYSDGVIVGSAIIDLIEKSTTRKAVLRKVGNFVASLHQKMVGD